MHGGEIERAYNELVGRSGPPRGDAAIVFRRIYAGPELPTSRLVTEGRFAHFESRERPVDVPDAARWSTAHCVNSDAGPSLVNPIALLDLPHPHVIEDVAVLARCWPAFVDAARTVGELHDSLAGWGTSALRRIVWLSPRLAITGMVGALEHDVLSGLRAVVHELASDYVRYGAVAEHEMWTVLAARGEVWPKQTDDTYAPGLPVAPAWVGRRVADTPSPFSRIAELEAAGFRITALAGEEAVLVLP